MKKQKTGLSELKPTSKTDPRLRQFLQAFSSQKKIDPEKILMVVRRLQERRSVRTLSAKQAKTVSALTSATTIELNVRSKLTDILMDLRNHELALKNSIDILIPYLLGTYASEFTQRAKGDRVDAVSMYWKPVTDYIGDLNRLIQVIEIAIKDIDQAAYSLQRLTNLYAARQSPVAGL